MTDPSIIYTTGDGKPAPPPTIIERCPECTGTGGQDAWLRCPKCAGVGVIEIPVRP